MQDPGAGGVLALSGEIVAHESVERHEQRVVVLVQPRQGTESHRVCDGSLICALTDRGQGSLAQDLDGGHGHPSSGPQQP